MPRLSDTMEEGRIGRWLKREGESFREGDVIAEIETDKATMEFQAYDDGTVLRIIVDDGETAARRSPSSARRARRSRPRPRARRRTTNRSRSQSPRLKHRGLSPMFHRRRPPPHLHLRETARPRCSG